MCLVSQKFNRSEFQDLLYDLEATMSKRLGKTVGDEEEEETNTKMAAGVATPVTIP